MSNHPLPNLRMIGLTDCTKNNSNIDVTSQGPPDELDLGGCAILREHEV